MPTFPIKGHRRSEIKDGVYLETSITLYADGRLDCLTHSWTKNKLEGAHGVVGIILYDKSDHALWYSGSHRCGVAGTWDSTGPSDRTEPWSEQVPPHVLPQVGGYAIVHENRGGSDILDYLRSNAGSIFAAIGLRVS